LANAQNKNLNCPIPRPLIVNYKKTKKMNLRTLFFRAAVLQLLALTFASTGWAQRITNPKTLFNPAPYGFSHVVTAPAQGKLVFVAGQGGEEDTQGKLTADFRTQVRQSLHNIKTALQSQQATMNHVVKVTTLVVDHDAEKLKIIIEEFKKMWPKQNSPVNTLIPVPKLAIEGMLVEIDATAVIR
jgi:enamine deaminase RidA (YjgF/YER057c/UK114 family)